MYYSLESCRRFPEDYKRSRNAERGTDDLLYIEKHIPKEAIDPSARAVEYTDIISAEGQDSANERPGSDIKKK